jgi:release factor glutamine methyltransferase
LPSSSTEPNILADFINAAAIRLAQAGIESAAIDARLLIAHGLTLDRAALISQSKRVLTKGEIEQLDKLVTRRIKHESVARIIGSREFWSLNFGLNEATLEPRPDSETVVQVVSDIVKKWQKLPRLLDLGTGSGCLLLSLLKEIPHSMGLGIDIAPRAIEQAQANAKILRLHERAKFQTGNWFVGLTEKFDVIVSNPPYIIRKDIDQLMPEVRNFDPLVALDGGVDGLNAYRHLVPAAKAHLKPGGLIAFEIGAGQAYDVATLLSNAGYQDIESHDDLSGNQRCITATVGYMP